jgi:hypothetical protein
MTFRAIRGRWRELYAGISSTAIALMSLARGLPLFLSARPRTPLRVLCIIAFDAVHRIRHAKPLPRVQLKLLAALLDFGACANAALDNKDWCPLEYWTTRKLLEDAGISSMVDEYLQRLTDLEARRPLPGGDERQFHAVERYREAVVRVSLGMVAATASGDRCLDEAILAIDREAEFMILFRIVMQCQIIDDALDYFEDISAGLPSFLTACTSLPQSFKLTRLATLNYARDHDVLRARKTFALRAALFLVSTCARLVIVLQYWTLRVQIGQQFAERALES